MEVFVVLALALAAFAVGMVVVAVVVLRNQVRALAEAGRTSAERMRALAAELQDEAAVLALESEGLQRRLGQGRSRSRGRYTAGDTSARAGS